MYRFLSFLIFPWSIALWAFSFRYHLVKFFFGAYLLIPILVLTIIFNFSIEGVVNIIGLWILIAEPKVPKIGDLSAKLLSYLIFGFISLGIIVSLITKVKLDLRYGLFAGEPNFGGQKLIFLFIIYRIVKRTLTGYDFVFLFTSSILFLYLSTSRTFLLMALLSILFYKVRGSKMTLILLVLLSYFVFLNLNLLFTMSNSVGIIRSSGYLDDYSRLLYLSDPSSIERLGILDEYLNYITNNIPELFFGFTFKEFQFNSHNSYVQIIQRNGIIFLLVQMFWMLTQKDLWKYVILLFYGLFLHNVLSIPYIIFLKLLRRND